MKEINDPRITQYLLNEMTPTEKQNFEKELQDNPNLKAMAEDLSVLTKVLKSEMSKESIPNRHIEGEELSKSFWSLKKLIVVAAPLTTAAMGILLYTQVFQELHSQHSSKIVQTKVMNEQTIETEDLAAPQSPPTKELVAINNVDARTVESDAVHGGSKTQMKGGYKKSNFGVLAKRVDNFGSSDRWEYQGLTPLPEQNREGYDSFQENVFYSVEKHPLSTFSIDVDTASYSNLRRFISHNQSPPSDAVRIEEMINYFQYNYPQPKDDQPFSVSTEMTQAPWNKSHHLLRIGLKGKNIDWSDRKSSNLVFLLDVSGSMSDPNKLPLVKQGIKLMVENMNKKDRVAIVVYAGNSGLVLPSTSGNQKEEILAALERLDAGGSTNGGAGIELAYKVAKENFIKGGINRVILATDGDFNVGTTSRDSLIELIKEKAKSQVFLTVLGFGSGNLQDSQMESIANKGNGHYAYIDSYREAKKVMVDQIGGTLMTIAKDVKIQLEFNPSKVAGYRLVGYENRKLNKEDFNDDKKDAGEIGAGHTVTALYEIVPAGIELPSPQVDKLKYQKVEPKGKTAPATNASEEWLTVKLRYKKPDKDTSTKIEVAVTGEILPYDKSSQDTRFASAVAGFGMLLRESKFSGDMKTEDILRWAKSAKGLDSKGYRQEFIELVEKYQNKN